MPTRAGGLGRARWGLCAQNLSVLAGPAARFQQLVVLGRLWHAALLFLPSAFCSLAAVSLLIPVGAASQAPLGQFYVWLWGGFLVGSVGARSSVQHGAWRLLKPLLFLTSLPPRCLSPGCLRTWKVRLNHPNLAAGDEELLGSAGRSRLCIRPLRGVISRGVSGLCCSLLPLSWLN